MCASGLNLPWYTTESVFEYLVIILLRFHCRALFWHTHYKSNIYIIFYEVNLEGDFIKFDNFDADKFKFLLPVL